MDTVRTVLCTVIVSFGDQATSDLYHGARSRRARSFPADVVPAALRKLDMLNGAQTLLDRRSPLAARQPA